MKRIAWLWVFVVGVAVVGTQAQDQWAFKGTVIKMRMAGCAAQHKFMAAMSGVPAAAVFTCPEYTIMTDKVVYTVVGHRAEDFMPLAENMEFLIRKNELVTFSDDEKTKSHFVIQQMMLRADWEHEEQRKDLAAHMMDHSVAYELHAAPRVIPVNTVSPADQPLP